MICGTDILYDIKKYYDDTKPGNKKDDQKIFNDIC